MHVVGKPRQPALVAAASQRRIERGSFKMSEARDANALFDLYDRSGQVGYGLNFKANAAAKIGYFVARREDPRGEPEPSEDPTALAAFDRLRGPLGEFPDFVGEFCLQLDIVGEGYLVGQERDGEVEFDVWSAVEWNDQKRDKRVPDETEPRRDDDFALRVWRSHPRKRQLPDSPLRKVAPEVEQYILLRDMITSTTWSRLPAGILKVPSELEIVNPDPTATQSGFMQTLTETLVTAVSDTQSATRVVPIVVRGPGERLAQMEMLDVVRDMPEKALEFMEKVLRQIAAGLDLPAEILLGMADINHWGQWLIDDSARLNHVDPLVLLILDSLTRGYLWPTLEAEGMAGEEARRFMFWRDYSDLTSRTLTVDEAIALYENGIISQDAVLRIADLSDEDAGDGVPLVADPINPDRTEDIPDTLVAAAPALTLGQIDHRLFTQISEAAQAAMDRAMERAGAKIRTHTKARNGTAQQFRTLIDGVPNEQVGLTLGRHVMEALQLTDDDLIPDGTFDTLAGRVARLLRRGQDEAAAAVQRLTGTAPVRDETVERSWVDRAVGFLTAALTGLALRRFFTADLDPDPAETGEVGDTDVPAADVWDTLTVASGGEPGMRDRGLANGPQTEQWISEADATVTGRVWTVGAPAEPFEPHQALSGVTFADWDDPRLVNPGGWPGAFLYPGDHRGCECLAVLVVEPPRRVG